MHGIHTHIPETNHVPRGYIVAAILSLLFMVPQSLVPALLLLLLLLLLSLLLSCLEPSRTSSAVTRHHLTEEQIAQVHHCENLKP
jgi:hypothetical protein